MIFFFLTCLGKSAWPELVGRPGREAETIIESENTLVDAIIIIDGSEVTTDFRCDRVWVRVSSTTGNVTRTPVIG